jgi:hypothetical protein
MAFIASFAVVIVATVLGAWINDHTELGGDYLSDEELSGQHESSH